MDKNTPRCLVITTCGSQEEAEKLAGSIIEAKLAACIQLSDIRSYYFWDGKVNNEPEVLLLIKTRSDLYDDLESHIRTHHSYEVPEIIRFPIEGGLPAYLDWIGDVTR
jgi:periplasmic divalent cation tolerance protein